MINFTISAPGRIVLSGQIGAKYGKRVVLASLNRRTKLIFREQRKTKNIEINFPAVDLSLVVPLKAVTDFYSPDDENFQKLISNHIQFLKLVESLVTLNGMWKTRKQRFSLEIFFFLLLHYAYNEKLDIKSFRMNLTTDLPLAAGLGSSSSFAVCLSACFLHWTRLQKGDHTEFSEEELHLILTYARLSEKVVQQDVCETDNDVCCYGKIIESQYFNWKDEYSSKIINAPTINILLVDLKIPFVLGGRANEIAEQKMINSESMNQCLDRSDDASEYICKLFRVIISSQEKPKLTEIQAKTYGRLQTSIWVYQSLLSVLQLSHEKLEVMCSIAHECGKRAGTFAGYEGKFAYILLPLDIFVERTTKLCTSLEEAGFDVTRESVSCKGLTIG